MRRASGNGEIVLLQCTPMYCPRVEYIQREDGDKNIFNEEMDFPYINWGQGTDFIRSIYGTDDVVHNFNASEDILLKEILQWHCHIKLFVHTLLKTTSPCDMLMGPCCERLCLRCHLSKGGPCLKWRCSISSPQMVKFHPRPISSEDRNG